MTFTNVREVFEEISQADPKDLQGNDGVVLFALTGTDESNSWTVTLEHGELKAEEGETAPPDVTITLQAQDLIALANRELNPIAAFMHGRIKLDGNLALAMPLQNLFM